MSESEDSYSAAEDQTMTVYVKGQVELCLKDMAKEIFDAAIVAKRDLTPAETAPLAMVLVNANLHHIGFVRDNLTASRRKTLTPFDNLEYHSARETIKTWFGHYKGAGSDWSKTPFPPLHSVNENGNFKRNDYTYNTISSKPQQSAEQFAHQVSQKVEENMDKFYAELVRKHAGRDEDEPTPKKQKEDHAENGGQPAAAIAAAATASAEQAEAAGQSDKAGKAADQACAKQEQEEVVLQELTAAMEALSKDLTKKHFGFVLKMFTRAEYTVTMPFNLTELGTMNENLKEIQKVVLKYDCGKNAKGKYAHYRSGTTKTTKGNKKEIAIITKYLKGSESFEDYDTWYNGEKIRIQES